MAEEALIEDPAKAAPDTEGTAPPVEAPVSGESTPVETKEPKTFKQEEVDEIVAKRLAKAQRKWEREQVRPQPQPQAVEVGELKPPALKDFADEAEYYKAVDVYADKKAELKAQKQAEERAKAQAEQQRKEMMLAHADREDEALEKYEDYHQVTRNPKLVITDHMLEAIVLSEVGTDIAYHLGKNPEEAARIAKLQPIAQAKEIGKLEVKLSSAPPPKTSKAPPPISPVKGSGATATAAPSDSDSVEVWKAKREAQIRAKQAAARTR